MKKHQHLRDIFQSSGSLSEEDIRRYLSDDLNPEQRFKIENTLLDSPLDQEAVEGFQEANYQFGQKKTTPSFQDFMANMDLDEATKVVPMNRNRTLYRALAVAASLLVLVFAANFVFNSISSTSNEELYANYFESFDSDLPNFRGDVDDQITVMQVFERAMEDYNKGNYETSIPFFEEYLASEPDSHFAMFYSGLAYLEINNTTKAIEMLKKAAVQNDNYKDKASWYLVMAYLKEGKRMKAQEVMENYVKRGAAFKKEAAQKLLYQLAH